MKKHILIAVFVGFIFSANAQILNIEQQRLDSDTITWAGKIWANGKILKNANLVYNFSSGIHLQYKKKKHLFLVVSNINFIQAGGNDFENAGFQHLRYNYKINKWLTAEAFTQAQFNKMLNVDFRGLLGAGARFEIMDKKSFYLAAGSLYMYEFEEISEGSIFHRDHRLSNYINLKYKLNKLLSFSNTTYFQPLINNFSDYRISMQNKFSFKISNKLSYNLSYNLMTDTNPPIGIVKTTYSFSNGLSYKF